MSRRTLLTPTMIVMIRMMHMLMLLTVSYNSHLLIRRDGRSGLNLCMLRFKPPPPSPQRHQGIPLRVNMINMNQAHTMGSFLCDKPNLCMARFKPPPPSPQRHCTECKDAHNACGEVARAVQCTHHVKNTIRDGGSTAP